MSLSTFHLGLLPSAFAARLTAAASLARSARIHSAIQPHPTAPITRAPNWYGSLAPATFRASMSKSGGSGTSRRILVASSRTRPEVTISGGIAARKVLPSTRTTWVSSASNVARVHSPEVRSSTKAPSRGFSIAAKSLRE
jgi:hypothetical protein